MKRFLSLLLTFALLIAPIAPRADGISGSVTPQIGGSIDQSFDALLGRVVPVTPAAVFLPTVSATPVAVYGMRRLVAAYSGPLIQVQRASDNATMDVAQIADGRPNAAAVASWAAGSVTTIRTWYDQSGNIWDATNTTLAEQPLFDATGLYAAATKLNTFKAAVFDGWHDGSVRHPKKLAVSASVTYNFQNHTVFQVIEPKTSIYNANSYSLRTAGGAEASAQSTTPTTSGVYTSGGGLTVNSGRRFRQEYQVQGGASSAAAYKFYQDGQIISLGPKWSDALAGGVIGDGLPGASDFLSSDNFLAFIIYPAALSDADGISVRTALNSTFGLDTTKTSQVVLVGDSIMFGPTVLGSQQNQTIARLLRPTLRGTPALYNMGIGAQTLSGGITTNAPTREDLLAVDGSFTKRVLVIEAGTNDLGGSGTTPGYGATLYTNLTNYITGRRAAGFTHILVCTILPRNAVASGQALIEYNDYNARVRANAAGANGIIDLAADPIMGNFANINDLTLFQGDALHPTGYGNTLLVPRYAAAINGIL